jgi:hypothetical protein
MGGGGDPAAAAQQQEADRQARVKAAVDKINGIFSGAPVTSGTNQATAFDPSATYYDADGNPWTPPTKVTQGTYGYDDAGIQNGFTPTQTALDTDAINQAIAGGKVFTGRNTVTPMSRDALYDQQKQAVTDLNGREVNRQYQQAERQNRFGLARSGLLGGSADVDSNAELNRKSSEGLIQASALGDQAAADLRVQDERSRQNLISQAQSGLDTGNAQAMALHQLDATNQSAAANRGAATIGNLFGDLGQAYLLNQQTTGARAGLNNTQQQYPNLATAGKGYSGTVQ